jgi:hypothetical protein
MTNINIKNKKNIKTIMALENKKSLVQFGYGYNEATSKQAGMLSFDASAQAIYVGDGEKANLVTSRVKDATYADNILTITKIDGSTHTLNFKDVASASGTMAAFNELKETIKNINDTIDALDSSYKEADKAINDKIGTGFDSTNTVAKAIEDAKSAAIAAGTVITESDDFITLESSVGENGATTYTIGTTNVAKATDLTDVSTLLAEVKVTAEAARTEDEVNAQINAKIDTLAGSETGSDDSGFVTVTVSTSKGEVSGVTVVGNDIASAATLAQVKGRVDTFLDTTGVADTVDTLKDIQDWINGEGVNATELASEIAKIDASYKAADTTLGNRIKAVEDDYLKSADKTELTNAINGVSIVANAAAVKTATDASLALKADASSVYAKSETYTKTEVDGLVAGANTNASNAESKAKAYADAIKVNGQAQSGQNITVSGINILVGGTGNNKDASVSYAIEDLYEKVGEAANAGVQSLSVDANSSNYASVDKSTGTVSLTIKKVALKDATESKTGVADAYDVKTSIATAKSEAISTVKGSEGDASTAETVAGAKAYADEQIAANALKWNIL